MAKTQPARFNFSGWSFKTWAIKNKDSLKLLLAGVSGIVVAALNGMTTPYGVVLGGIATTVTKMIADAIDYWQSP